MNKTAALLSLLLLMACNSADQSARLSANEARTKAIERQILTAKKDRDEMYAKVLALELILTKHLGTVQAAQQIANQQVPAPGTSEPSPASRIDLSGLVSAMPTGSPNEAGTERVVVVSVDTRVTETNSTWSRHSYVLTLHNAGQSMKRCFARVEWLDANNFTIDDRDTETVNIAPGATVTLTGYDLIEHPQSERVQRVKATVRD